MNIRINKKDDVILKILHYFVTEEDYKPVIINGVQNEIWLENMEKDIELIRINTNSIINNEQFRTDTFKARSIMRTIKKNTFSFNMNMLNILTDADDINIKDNIKNMEIIKINKITDFKDNNIINEFFPSVKDAVLNEEVDPMEFFKLTDDMNQDTMRKEKKLQKIFSPKKPYGTYALIVINIVMFLAQFTLGYNIEGMFANNYAFLQSGQWYRLITCMFLHGNLIHLLCNMYALYILGPQVERYYGLKKFLLIYFISGLLGSLFSASFMSVSTFSLGASGAIFGLLGSIAYFTYNYRATLQGLLHSQVVPVIVLNLALGLFISNIDMFAHIGGLIGGVLISMAIGIGDKYRKNDQINGSIVLILMTLFLIYFITIK